jgi:pSer/pThr/pTyr-binding forkhead associated (FHA) protein
MPVSETAERRSRRSPFGTPRVFVLAVIDGADTTTVHRLTVPETVIGRDGDADVSLEDPEVSKRHLLIRLDGPVCELLDLDSRNGTRLNGRPVRPGLASRLRHLDEIQLGTTRMLLLTGRFRREPRRG